MMAHATRRLLLLSTALVAAIVVAVMFRTSGSPGGDPVIRRSSGEAPAAQRLDALLPPATLEVGVVKNPFQKPEQPVKPESAPAPPPGQPQTSGARMTGWARLGDKDYALVITADGEKYVQAGDSVNGWQVAEVHADKVVLQLGDEHEVVQLKSDFSVTPLRDK